MNTSIPQNIKRLRKQAGLTQEQMAEKLFVTRQTVSLWELGKSKPDIDTLQAIADCFQTDLTTVLYGAEAPENKERQLLLRLVIWGVVTLLLGIGSGLLIKWFERKMLTSIQSAWYPKLYYWTWLYIRPVLMMGCGVVLAVFFRPVAEKISQVLRLLFALPCAGVSVVYYWFWICLSTFRVPYLGLLVEPLPNAQWVFLIIGYGIAFALPRRKK